jgi:hypothetical protein
MSEAMDTMESTIQRARMALCAGVSEADVFDAISKQETPDIAFFAIQAAKCLLKIEVGEVMPKRTNKIIYEYTTKEIEELVIKSLGSEADGKKVDVVFDIGERNYDGPGSGIPFLRTIKVTIQEQKES